MDKTLLKYKQLITHPEWSENIYMEINITNLENFYQRARSELHEVRTLFKIKTAEDEKNVMRPLLTKDMRRNKSA